MIKYTVCFTGHRPNGLPWGYSERGLNFWLFKRKLKKVILNAIKDGYCNFISGVALGVDIICAELILKLKKQHPNITLECAIPCANQTQKWTEQSKKRYKRILLKADKITYVSNKNYYSGCMQAHNEYMIKNSNLDIAVYNNKDGGTKQTIELAKKHNKKIIIINV